MTVICLRDEGFNVFRVQKDTGSVTGHTADTVTDSAKAWTPNEWQDHAVRFTSGNHNARSYNIISNTADTLTCTIPLGSSVSGENIDTGDGGTKIFSGTLADPVDVGTLSITDTVETFTDNGDGTLTGDQTGSGTITYATGAWSVTFNTAPTGGQAITADYDPVFNFNCDGGLANGNTFEIIEQGKDLVQNATPGGSADLADQPIITTVALSNQGFFIFVSAGLPGITYEVTALVNHGVTSSGAGWTLDDWVGYRIEFTDGALAGNDYVICHNSAANIFGQSIDFPGAGVLVGDHFKITAHFIDLVEDATPGGGADLSDQAVMPVAVMSGEGFYIFVSPYGAPATIYEISSLVDGGLKVADIDWLDNIFATGYRIEFTDGVLSGQSFVVSRNTGEEMYSAGIEFSDEGVLAGDHFKLTLDYIDLKEKKWLLLRHHRMTGGLTHRPSR